MHHVFRSVTAVLVAIAVVTPSLDAPLAAGLKRSVTEPDREAAVASGTAFVARQEKLWGRLSASICSGCITAANRIAPVSYERQAEKPAAEVKVATAQGAVRVTAPPRKFVQLRKRYAKHHRRDRLRLAARVRVRAALLAKRRALRLAALKRHQPAPVRATFVPAYETGSINTVYRIPADQPFSPRDDGRWHETILPTAARMRRG